MTEISSRPEKIPFRIHPRVFAALGSDLVTSDVVAVIELVKNSYDALASRVDVLFRQTKKGGCYLEVLDDGVGMDRDVIEAAWCVVATPFRKLEPVAKKRDKTRAVSGEKGLGRLSTARLGESMELVTQTEGGPCWTVTLNWEDLSGATDMSDCYVACSRCTETPFQQSGTRIRVYRLKSEWTDLQLGELHDNLARLISPFRKATDFTIYLTPPSQAAHTEAVQITAPDFLSHPPYAIRGHVTASGEIRAKYEFNPLSGRGGRDATINRKWTDVLEGADQSSRLGKVGPGCGPFSFEIRAWDIGQDDTQDIADKFRLRKAAVRQSIRSHKGLSIYRDNILVLPKSEDARDWLGLDLRRVSRVGNRLSTSQIVGYVSITAAANPKIGDTSDRERLVRNQEVLGFQELLRQVVTLLEIERDTDRHKPEGEVKLEALLDGVSAGDLVQELVALQEDGADISEALERVRGLSERLDLVRRSLKKRFVYYSRLATVGTIAEMLVHEIRNRTTAIARFLRFVGRGTSGNSEQELTKQLAAAEGAVSSLERLADTFAPLASRSFKRGRRDAVVEQSFTRCLTLLEPEIDRQLIDVSASTKTETRVAMDPGELDVVLLNLLQNAVYWLSRVDKERKLNLSVRRAGKRAKIAVHDSGTGIKASDRERIFLAGVTRKPAGIGMGLTVAAELIAEHNGRLFLVEPPKLGGASFEFDLPLTS